MRSRKRLLLCLSVLVAVALALWQFWPSQKLSYEGKALKDWVLDLGENRWNPKATAAIQALGTNALPALIDAVNQRPGETREQVFSAISTILQKLHLRSRPLLDAKRRAAIGALRAFDILGATASNAIPVLAKTMDTNADAIEALGYIGPASIPVLTNALQRCGPQQRLHIFLAFCQIGTNASVAVPMIIAQLQDTTSLGPYPMREIAAMALGCLKSDPATVVPALTNLFQDPNSGVRMYAVQSVGEFSSRANFALPAVRQLLNDSHVMVRESATNALEAIENNAPFVRPGHSR